MKRKFPIREGDLPRHELFKKAQQVLEELGGVDQARVYFKFTCPECGERCQFVEPNQLYERGTCGNCNHDAPVTHGGFSVELNLKGGWKQ